MLNRPLSVLFAGVAAISFGPAVNAQASTQASAQAKPAPAAPQPIARTDIVRQIDANYKTLDANGDKAVTVAEIQAAQTRAQQAIEAEFVKRRDAAFRELDTNKDGQLNAAEFNAGSKTPRLNRPAPASIIQEMDSNKDQKISPTEFSANTLANFDRADANRDGIVTPAEAQSARATRR